MADLFWPGDERAGDLFSDTALVSAMLDVERAWLTGLVNAGIAPATMSVPDLHGLVGTRHHEWLAQESEVGGNPAAALVSLLRDGLRENAPDASRWLHRGLTSQDVVDTALMVCARDARDRILAELRSQVDRLSRLVGAHRATPMVARTLTQHAIPTTFGLKAAGWLTGVLDAYDDLAALMLPVQVGGAAGSMAGTVELARRSPDPVGVVQRMTQELADALGLSPSLPWHTSRATVTRLGDASVRCTDAWGRIANDVLTLSRPEVGELSEAAGGGSSTMPNKANPVLSALVRRAALTTPQLAATLHLASAESVDERSAGPWHAEWATLRTLLRRTVVAGEQAGELLGGLRVHADRMRQTLTAAEPGVRAEQRSLADLLGDPVRDDYSGAGDAFVDATLARAATTLAHPAADPPADPPADPVERPERTP
jgi:3-carboxy-cis,cis-muconate cycloisomerase